MATFGEALEALDDFRTALIDGQQNIDVPAAEALAFRAGAAVGHASALTRIHATGVGVREGIAKPGKDSFVIKVYVFDKADIDAARAEALLNKPHQGVEVDVQHLPVQVAFATAAANPAAHQKRRRPVPAGVEIGPLGGNYVGTLGCFVRRGSGAKAPLFVLSNNHVLSDVNRLPIGSPFTQPFSAKPADVICTLSAFQPIQFPTPALQPRNVIDAAIAAVTDPAQVKTGSMLNIANYTPQLLAPRPGMLVTKAGRTTGVTRGVIRAIRVRGVQVNYGTLQNPIIATFDNAITITGAAGAFSRPGDSGSVILDQASGRPVALLFAGNGATTTACDIATACAQFGVRPV